MDGILHKTKYLAVYIENIISRSKKKRNEWKFIIRRSKNGLFYSIFITFIKMYETTQIYEPSYHRTTSVT